MPAIADRIVLSNGVQIPYVERGNRTGTPVVFIPGITDTLRSYEPLLSYLPEQIRAIAITQRGHGDASKPLAGYTIDDFGRDAIAFLDEMGIERAVLVGHSLGSVVAQHVAAHHPDRLADLVLLGALYPKPDNPLMLEYWRDFFSTLADPLDQVMVREFQESTLIQQVPPDFLDTVVSESQKAPARVWRDSWHALVTMDVAAKLSGVEAPALLVWGARDSLALRSDQNALLSALPNARLTVHESAGHGVHWEEPERVANEIAEFIVAMS